VAKLVALIGNLPQHELAIRRLCGLEPDFMATCEDYEEAAAALRRWEEAGPGHAARADEYRVILCDIEAEILKDLSTPRPRVPRHGT